MMTDMSSFETCDLCGYTRPEGLLTCPCTWVRSECPDMYKYACLDDALPLPEFTPTVLTLQGLSGIGKTHTAWALAKELTAEKKRCIIMAKATDLPALPSERDKYLADIKTVDMLIIDEFTSDFYGVIDHRMEARLSTILTTNDSLSSFKHDRLYSRLYSGFVPCNRDFDLRMTHTPDDVYKVRKAQHRTWQAWLASKYDRGIINKAKARREANMAENKERLAARENGIFEQTQIPERLKNLEN